MVVGSHDVSARAFGGAAGLGYHFSPDHRHRDFQLLANLIHTIPVAHSVAKISKARS